MKWQILARKISSGTLRRLAILALICTLSVLPSTSTGQVADPTASKAAAVRPKVAQDEIRLSVLRQLREKDLIQVLKLLEIPGESSLPISLVEHNSLDQVSAGLNRALSQLDYEAQFELLSRWTFPGRTPKLIRRLTALVPTLAPPAEFARALGERPRANSFPVASIGPIRGIFSTEWSLVIAAQKSGRLKRLTTELTSMVEQKVPGAERLLTLVRIVEDRSDVSSVSARLSERIAQLKSQPNQEMIDSDDLVLAASALNRQELRPPGEELFNTLIAAIQARPAPAVRPFLRQAHATACLLAHGDTGASDVANVLEPRLKFWIPVVRDLQRSNSHGLTDVSWLVHEDQILHLTGSPNDLLLFRYPLTGDFRFQCEIQLDGQSQTNGWLHFGGRGFQTEGGTGAFNVLDAGGNVIGNRTWSVIHPAVAPTFNRMSIESTAKAMTVSVNLHPLWAEPNGRQVSPWLGLSSRGDASPLFRNLQLTGHPVIPRSVRLSNDDLLRSWQRQAWSDDRKVTAKLDSDWSVFEGLIQTAAGTSERQTAEIGSNNRLAQSLLSYDRPLLGGETVNYEFFYEPAVSEVHPALGRIGFLLQPDGIRIHWMTDGDDWTSLSPENAVAEPLCRRGPRQLPLKTSEWNRMSVARTDQTVTLTLNDVVIYERPIDWVGDLRFGLYRQGTSSEVKVRHVDVTGDWPEILPEEFLKNPAVTVGEPVSISQSHCLNRIFQEDFLTENLSAVRRKALTMSVVDRFEYLSHWVLPGRDHPGFRMIGEFTQTQPAKAAYEPGVEHPDFGGQIVSPVFDWLDAASELGRLPECLTHVDGAVTPDTDFQRRARISLSLLLNLELGNSQIAAEQFEALYKLIQPAKAEEQWPEMLVIDRSVCKFATNDVAAKFMADIRTLKTQQSKLARSSVWQAQMVSLLGQSQSLKANQTQDDSGESKLKDWILVTAATAATRGQGHPVARWQHADHKSLKQVSHEDDFLFYRSPLSGDYEVECNLIDSSQVMIGGSYLGARSDRKALDLGTFRAAAAGEPVDPQFSPFWPSVHYRVAIRNGTRSISINGRPVKSEKLPENSDPWLAIRCAGRSRGGVHDLRITGQPRVPESVSLSNSRELTGWIAYHGEPVLNQTSGWTHVDAADSTGWIVGHSNPAVEGMSIEGLLRYQRPLVEDGFIEYEFFYDANAFETHPALDRLAFLLNPSGIQEHWIGDGRYDRTDLQPNNQTDVLTCRRGPSKLPLVEREWNRIRLSLQGPTVRIELNGQLIYERNLEPTNQRTFGLFHFLGNRAVRVRNAVMRGDWPNTIPPATAQELADDTTDKLDTERAGLNSEFSHDFQKNGVPDQYFKSPGPNPTIRIIPGPQGVQASQRAVGPHAGFNIIPRFSLCGDFDIEAHFTGLRIEGSGDAGIMLNATLEEPLRHEYRALRMKTTPGNQDLHSSVSLVRPDGGRTYVGDSRTFEALRGRIRLSRRGQRVFYLFAENDSDHFFLFGSEPSSEAETAIDGIFLHSFCNGVSISQVTWTKLVLRAAQIKWHSQTLPPPQEYLSVMDTKSHAMRIVAAPKSVGFTSVLSPEWSPDRGKIVMEMTNGLKAKSHVFSVNTDGTQLKDLGLGCSPSFSADGSKIVCSVPGTGIVTMQSDGADRQVIAAVGWGAKWSPEGTSIAFAEGENINIFDVNSGKCSHLLQGEVAARYKSIDSLSWSHDGRSIAFKAQRRDLARNELCLVGLDHGSGFQVLHPNAHAVSPDIAFSSDDQRVFVSIKGLSGTDTNLYALNCKQPGPATPVFTLPLANHRISGYAWSHDGSSLAITSHYSPRYVEWINESNSGKEPRK